MQIRFNKAIHMLLIQGFLVSLLPVKHSRAITKSDVNIRNMQSSKHNFLTSELCHHLPWRRSITGAGKRNLLKHFLQCFRVLLHDRMFLYNNSDQTWFSDTFTSARTCGRCWNQSLKPWPFRHKFQHLPRDSADLNAWKIMFDPHIVYTSLCDIANILPWS